MKTNIPKPAVIRLCTIFHQLEYLLQNDVNRVSSTVLGKMLGVGSHNIRKDISYLGEVGDVGSGYDVVKLKDRISDKLGLSISRNACVVGLGRLGSAILEYERFIPSGYKIVAGFDSNINRIETIRTSINIYPSHMITDIVMKNNIELAVIAVPASSAQDVADRLILGGIKGIVNFSPALISYDESKVHITNIDVIREFTVLAAQIGITESKI